MAIRPGNAPLNTELVVPAGTTRADATQIPANASPCLVKAAGDGTAGIRLPKAVAGKCYQVKNSAGSALLVYPYDTTDQINAIAAGSAISMAANTSAWFSAFDSSTWYTTPLLPS